jgi:hypothetical protein
VKAKSKISVLVSYPDHFEVVEITPTLDEFQKLVGGYIENVPRPTYASGWYAYCTEEGKFEQLPPNFPSNDFLDRLYNSEGFPPYTTRDYVVGNLVWLSNSVADDDMEASLPVEYVQRFASAHIESAWKRSRADKVITIVRDGKDIWVYDQRQGALIPQTIAALVRGARSRPDHGTIEVWCTSPDKWVELRVELMDDVTGIVLHDERDDKSFG